MPRILSRSALRRFRLGPLALALALSPAAGCAGTNAADDGGATPQADLRAADPVAVGKALVTRLGCPSCHDPGDGSLSGRLTPIGNGRVFASNLTPDEDTGIGGWTDDAIATAVRTGIDDEGVPLCPPMPHFADIDDTGMAALVAYLRSLRAVSKEIPDSICPPLKGGVVGFGDGGARDDLAAPPPDMTVAPGPDGGARDLAVAPADMTVPADFAGSKADLAQGKPDMTVVPDLLMKSDGGAPACHAVINEVQTAGLGGATDEFIELYNPCAAAIDFTDVTLVYRSSAGVKDIALLAFVGQFPARGRFLCGGDGYFGLADAWYSAATSIASKGGGVALRYANGSIMDSVGYGDATNAFVRVAAAPAPDVAQSIERLPDGNDSADNKKDFTVTKAPTPGTANK